MALAMEMPSQYVADLATAAGNNDAQFSVLR
jgi:hypothetical protein